MKRGWLRFFEVRGCFRAQSSDSRSQQPITGIDSEFYSPRIAVLIEQRKSNPGREKLELEVEASRVTWSELSPSSGLVGEALAAENLSVFRGLQEQWHGENGKFFEDWNGEECEVGEKIAEGGQAEIFELRWRDPVIPPAAIRGTALKMFKEGLRVQDLQRLMPEGMLADHYSRTVGIFSGGIHCNSILGVMLINGRFALRMHRRWGDLRKLIDVRMVHNHMHGPPLTFRRTLQCMLEIADGMESLHATNVTHRDLKAANVLVGGFSEFDPLNLYRSVWCDVADYECSVGVVGTRFWRAPEILLAVKNQNVAPELFSKASDVYSYGMTCYEILTGRIPFELEGLRPTEYDRVIDGCRPTLPSNTLPWMKTLLDRCWHGDPTKRPTFMELVGLIERKIEELD